MRRRHYVNAIAEVILVRKVVFEVVGCWCFLSRILVFPFSNTSRPCATFQGIYPEYWLNDRTAHSRSFRVCNSKAKEHLVAFRDMHHKYRKTSAPNIISKYWNPVFRLASMCAIQALDRSLIIKRFSSIEMVELKGSERRWAIYVLMYVF